MADNSVVVATDSMKNTIYIKAKEHPVNPPELFASTLGQHFLDTYAHIHTAHIKIVVHRWTRMVIDGQEHPHSFFRDGQETRNVEAVVSRAEGITVKSAIVGLTVLKSTGSAFHGFVRDEFTTLGETWDRILSTDVDCGWTWSTFGTLKDVEQSVPRFDDAWEKARAITMKLFAQEESPSVQNTMYKMCEHILDAVPEVASANYSLPNKHYFEIGKSLYSSIHRERKRKLSANQASLRPELAQGPQEHGQGRRGVRPPVWPQWAHQMRGGSIVEILCLQKWLVPPTKSIRICNAAAKPELDCTTH